MYCYCVGLFYIITKSVNAIYPHSYRPEEDIPPFPTPTYLNHRTTIASLIDRIPNEAQNHSVCQYILEELSFLRLFTYIFQVFSP